ncbi:hypothetical protein CHS0354_008788 [Potamilus streckersoni]|uniref:Uncharacterized protein n=1 Tax=Potamilus streckersoni TaxID=2493646 RepID=A0AAE0W036_9BIVA|nr:hypothetical protein CHS0354_008788 [Potamilus streckersoni]
MRSQASSSHRLTAAISILDNASGVKFKNIDTQGDTTPNPNMRCTSGCWSLWLMFQTTIKFKLTNCSTTSKTLSLEDDDDEMLLFSSDIWDCYQAVRDDSQLTTQRKDSTVHLHGQYKLLTQLCRG